MRKSHLLIVFSLFISFLLIFGCTLDFLNESNDNNGNKESLYYSVDENYSSGLLKIRRTYLKSNDQLVHSEYYTYTDNDDVKLQVRYNSSDELVWYLDHYYDSADRLVKKVNYDADDNVQWFEIYEYTGENIVFEARINPNNTPETVWAYKYVYDSNDNVLRKYTFDSGKAVVNYTVSTYNSDDQVTLELYYEVAEDSSRALTLPNPPAAPATEITSADFSINGVSLPLSWKKMYLYDDYGHTMMKVDGATSYPLEMFRTDNRLTNNITIAITYDESNRPISKLTTYGITEVLLIEIEYNSDSLMSRISTSGRSLIVPLTYTLDYNDSNLPERFSIYQDTNLLHYFTYEYADELNTIDFSTSAFDLLQIEGKIASIGQYDGDNNHLGNYNFVYNNQNTEITVNVVKANGDSNGKFVLSKDENGNVVKFESFDKNGDIVWHYEYDFDPDTDIRLSSLKYDADQILTLVEELNYQELLF